MVGKLGLFPSFRPRRVTSSPELAEAYPVPNV
jgi:hypothetical protein